MTNPVNPVIADIEAFLKQFKTVQGAITGLTLVISLVGGWGLFSTQWTGLLKALVSVVGAIILLATHQAVTNAALRRAARKTARV